MVVRGPLDDRRLPAQTQWVSIGASEQPHRTRHTALGCIPALAHPDGSSCIFRWRWMRMQVRLSALLACTSSNRCPARLRSQRLNAAWFRPTTGTYVHCRRFTFVSDCILPAGSDRSFMQPVQTSILGSADEQPCLAFRPPVTSRKVSRQVF